MLRAILVVLAGFLLFANPVFAVAPTISNTPTTISTDTQFSLSTTMSGLSSNTIYRMRLALTPIGTSNYFGSTWNGTSWYNGTPSPINYANFLSVTTDGSGAWSGTIQGRVESSDPNFPGTSGTYDLKVGRYTATGTSPTWSNIIQVSVASFSTSPSPIPSSNPSSSFSISEVPAEIASDKSFSVPVTINLPDYPNTKFYLKGAFKKSGSQNYFGQTKVGEVWVGNSKSYGEQYAITTDSSGSWSGTLEVQPDILDSGYDGAGAYLFKVGKYSSAGSLTWSNEVNIQISAKEVTSGTLDNTPNSPTAKTAKPKTQDLPDEVYSLENYRKSSSIAGITIEATSTTHLAGERFKNPFLIFGGVLVTLGLGTMGVIIFRKWKST